jgi:hypothetical protein
MSLNITNDLRIDPMALDREWLNQANLTYQYEKEAVDVKRDMEDAKEALDVITAQVALEVRNAPAKFKLEKATDPATASAVANDPRVQAASKRVNQAKHAHGLVQAALRAIEAKRTSLENLVKLMAMNYWATPNEPRVPVGGGRVGMDRESVRATIRRRMGQ